MELAAIKFYSGPGGANALSIRQNFGAAVAVPEWVKGKSLAKDSPTAYAIAGVAGKVITIQVSFTSDSSDPAAIYVRADGGGVLGPIDPIAIQMSGGVSVPGFVTLNLSHHKIGAAGIL